MKYRAHLAIDLDDVVLDLTGGVARTVAREHGVPEPVFDSWNMDRILKPILGQPWMKWMRSKDWLWATFPAIDGAIGGLERLRQDGFYLECVTSKPQWAEPQVWKWLGLWRPAFHRVTIVGPDDRKVDRTSADLIVDDKPENCMEFLAAGRSAVLFTRPHNADLPIITYASPRKGELRVASAVRAGSWSGILEVIKNLYPENSDG